MKNAFLPFVLAGLTIASPVPAQVGPAADVVSVELLEGWRKANGRHVAAIRLKLAEGWKTYWRAPGDGGLPTRLQWSHSDNLKHLRILWPRPQVFDVGGLRSLGYHNEVVLPLELTANKAGDISLKARLHFGVCKEVCVPAVVDLKHILRASTLSEVAIIRSALNSAPMTATQAGIQNVTCTIEATPKGHALTVDVAAKISGKSHAMVIEMQDPEVWVSRTDLKSNGEHWHGVSQIFDHRNTPAPIEADDIRITLLTETTAVDIRGCN